MKRQQQLVQQHRQPRQQMIYEAEHLPELLLQMLADVDGVSQELQGRCAADATQPQAQQQQLWKEVQCSQARWLSTKPWPSLITEVALLEAWLHAGLGYSSIP